MHKQGKSIIALWEKGLKAVILKTGVSCMRNCGISG